jgi:hypothetical protein
MLGDGDGEAATTLPVEGQWGLGVTRAEPVFRHIEAPFKPQPKTIICDEIHTQPKTVEIEIFTC